MHCLLPPPHAAPHKPPASGAASCSRALSSNKKIAPHPAAHSSQLIDEVVQFLVRQRQRCVARLFRLGLGLGVALLLLALARAFAIALALALSLALALARALLALGGAARAPARKRAAKESRQKEPLAVRKSRQKEP